MPRKCINYSKSSVYRIVQNDTTHYVGSTTNLVKRKYNHTKSQDITTIMERIGDGTTQTAVTTGNRDVRSHIMYWPP